VDKVLCNEQGVESYPEVIHYKGGDQVAKFVGRQKKDAERLQKWLKREFETITNSSKPSANNAEAIAQDETSIQNAIVKFLAPGSHGTDLLLAFVALAASFRLVLSNSEVWDKSKPIPCTLAAHSLPEQASGTKQAIPEEWARCRAAVEL